MKVLRSALRALRLCAYRLVQLLSARVLVLEGRPQGSSLPLRCLFIGDGWVVDYLKAKFASGAGRFLKGKREPFWKILRRLETLEEAGIDLCVLVGPPVVVRRMPRPDFEAFQAIAQRIPTPDWATVRSNLSPNKRRLVNGLEKAQPGTFACRLSRDEADFHFFYERCFLPLIQRKYGPGAMIDPMPELLAKFRRGFLLFADAEIGPVGAVLLVPEGRSLAFHRIGVLDGDEAWVRAGVQVALYYFQIRYAVENGYDLLDTMLSAPFLSDGVYRNKEEWGACPSGDTSLGPEIHLFLRGDPARTAAFFAAHPLVVKQGDGLGVLAGMPVGVDDMAGWATSFARQWRTRGLKALVPLHSGRGLQPAIDLAREVNRIPASTQARET